MLLYAEDSHVWITNEDGVTVCRICGTKRRGEGRMFVSMQLAPLATKEK